MKVTPASVKIRRWFVAGVAAVMAIAWTVSSLITPGSADVAIPENNAASSVGELPAGGNYQYVGKVGGGGWSPNAVYYNSQGVAVSGSNAGRMHVQGVTANGTNQKINVMCIDQGHSVQGNDNYMQSHVGEFKDNRPYNSAYSDGAAPWLAANFGPEIASGNYNAVFSKLGLPNPKKNWTYYREAYREESYSGLLPPPQAQIDDAVQTLLQGAFWSLGGNIDLPKTRMKTGGGTNWDMPKSNAIMFVLGTKLKAELIKAQWTGQIGAAGSSTPEWTSVEEAGFNANGQYVVTYKFAAPQGAKEGTVSITGMPKGGKLINNANGAEVTNGSKVALPATLTLILPDKTMYASVKIKVNAEVGGGTTTVDGYHVVPIDITGAQGITGTIQFTNLPAGAKVEDVNGNTITPGETVLTLPTRILVYVKPGTMTGPITGHFIRTPGVPTANAQVSVFEQSRSVLDDGSTHIRIGVTGVGDGQEATLSVSNLPAGATLKNGQTTVGNGTKISVPTTLDLIIPKGTPTSTVTIGATTTSHIGGEAGTILKPSNENGQWLITLEPVPSSDATANASIKVTWENIVPPKLGKLAIKKVVSGGPATVDNNFEFNVKCVNGESAYPEEKITVTAGGEAVQTTNEYPEGTVCTIEENPATAAIDGYTFKGTSYSGGNVDGDPTKVKITGTGVVATVTATNAYEKQKPKEGQFTIQKVVEGAGDTVNNEYSFTVACDGYPEESFTLSHNGTKLLGPYKENTSCTIAEDTEAGTAIEGYDFNGVSYSQPNGSTQPTVVVKDGMDTSYIFKATNKYSETKKGYFKVIKEFDDESQYSDETRSYKFDVECRKDGVVVGKETIWADATTAVKSNEYEVGTVCTVKEDVEEANTVPGYELVKATFSIDSGIQISGESPNQTATVTITEPKESHIYPGLIEVPFVKACNKYERLEGSFAVTKKVTGVAASVTDPYTIKVTCDDAGNVISEEKVINANETVTFGPYNTGTVCTVEEDPATAAISGYTFNGATIEGGNVEGSANKVKIDGGAAPTVTVTVTNDYTKQYGSLSVKKVVTGGPEKVNNDYTFVATCDGAEKRVTAKAGQTVSFGSYPVGTQCTVVEETTGTAITNYTYNGVTYSGGEGTDSNTVTIAEGDKTYTITATNDYTQDTGTFDIVKQFAANSSFTGDASKKYEFNVTCDGKAVNGAVVSQATNWKWTSDEYPVGTQCTVAEKMTAGVKGHSFKGVDLTATSGSVTNNKATFTIAKGETPGVTVTATNDYVKPTLKTDASVQGDNALEKDKPVQLQDKLTFTGLQKGKTYTVGGYFIDKATGEAVTEFYTKTLTTDDLQGKVVNGNLVDGYIVLTDPKWTVTPNTNAGQAFVAFEYLWEGELPTTPEVPNNPGTDEVTPTPDEEHENPDDPNQTVSSEKKGQFTIEKKVVGEAADKVAADAVFPFTVNCGTERIENVKVGETFTSAELPVGTQCSVTENSAPVHFEGATFEKVAYTINGQKVSGDTATFTIKEGDAPKIAVVATNTYTPPTVTTDAEPEAPAQEGKPVTVVDTVTYTNLIAGKEYTVEGQLHYQNGDAPGATDGGIVEGVQPGPGYTVGSKPNSVATTFVAPGNEGELVSGTVELVFVVPAEAVQSKPMVVFEDVYYDGKKVAGHHDINDDAQTVPVNEKIEFPVKKILDGDGADQANGTYNFVANCAKPGETGADQALSVNVTDGVSAVSAKKVVTYVGETCTIKELPPADNPAVASKVNFDAGSIAGATGGETLTVKVTDDNKAALSADGFAFEVTNTVTVNKASFSVAKTDAIAEGNVTLPSNYTFEYNCAGKTGTLTVGKGQTVAGPDFPIGTNCTIKEVNADVDNADRTTSWKIGDAAATPNAAGEVAFTLSETNSVIAVSATNKYVEKTGKFTLTKKLSTSITTGALEGTTFKFNYSCGADGKVVKKSNVPVEVIANGAPVTVSGVPYGATCTVEEVELPDTPNAVASLSWTVKGVNKTDAKAEFMIDSQTVPVDVIAHNIYTDKKPGFQVVKLVEGDAKDLPKDFAFTFDYSCDNGAITGSFDLIDGGPSFQSSADPTLKDLKVGTECTITERQPADVTNAEWKGVVYDRSGNTSGSWMTNTSGHAVTFTLPAGDTAVIVKATNTLDQERGKIDVTKKVDANGVEGIPTGFTFGIDCTYKGVAEPVEPVTKTIRAGETATWDNLPVGAECTVTELPSTVPDNSEHVLSWTVDNADQGAVDSVTVPVKAGSSGVAVTATNAYSNNPAKITVKKNSATVTGESIKNEETPVAPSEFNFSYQCGDATEWTPLGTAVTVGGDAVTVEGLPANETCKIREESDGLNRITKWTVNGVDKPAASTIEFTTTPGATIDFVVDNEYPTGPQIGTELTDEAGNHDVSADGESVILKDVVKYYNLDTTKTYKASGKLMAWDSDGNVIETGITGESEEFIPTTPNGEVIVNFTVPSAKLDEFAKVVAYEKLYMGGEVVAEHENPDDENQIDKVNPKIGTTLTGEDGESKSYDRPTDPNTVVKLVDTVDYTNLRVGKTYRISGELYGDNGLTGVKAMSEPFTATAPEDDPDAEFVSGSVKITFNVPGSVLQENTKLVAFEQLWDEGKLTPSNPGDEEPTPENPNDEPDAKHEDPDDENQTVTRNPSIATSAVIKDNDGPDARVKTIQLTGEENQVVEVIDNLSWYDLPEGDYVAVATVVDRNEAPVNPDGSANGTKAFTVTADPRQGVVEVPMTIALDTTADVVRQLDIVVYEHVYKASDVTDGVPNEGATPVATHEDINDANQTIKVTVQPPLPPEGKLTVKKVLGEAEGFVPLPKDTLYGFEFSCKDSADDVVRFALKADEEATDIWPADIFGKECTVTEVGPVKAQYNETDGWKKLEVENIIWSDVVWSNNGEEQSNVVEGEQPGAGPANSSYTFVIPVEGNGVNNDVNVQATNFFKPYVPPAAPTPTLKTSAEDMRQNNPVNGVDRTVRWGSDAAIVDTVTFTDLQVGKEYVLKGQIMDKDTNQPVSNVTITNKNACGAQVDGGTFTAAKCKDEGNGVISLTFTLPGEANAFVNGTATMQFRIGASSVKENAKFVVFEEVFVKDGGDLTSVVKHHDINDKNQTVTTEGCPPVPPENPPTPDLPDNPGPPPTNPEEPGPDNCPRLSTTLEVEGGADLVSGKDHKMVDTIYYEDLLPNTTYTMKGRLHVGGDNTAKGIIKSVTAGTKCFADSKPATCKDVGKGFVEIEFTTGAANNVRGYTDGTVDMEFVVPAAVLKQTDKVVAFETAYDAKGYMVAWHHDINAESQTQIVKQPPTPPVPPKGVTPPGPFRTLLAKTGAGTFTLLALGLMGLIGGAMLVWASPSRRRNEEQ